MRSCGDAFFWQSEQEAFPVFLPYLVMLYSIICVVCGCVVAIILYSKHGRVYGFKQCCVGVQKEGVVGGCSTWTCQVM